MADDFFKVRNGFTVGEDIFTVDGTTGDVVVTGDLEVQGGIEFTGDLAVNGGDITTTSTTATVFNTTATTLNIGGAATTMSIGNGSGTVTIPGNLTVNGTTTTINTQDLLVEDKNITIGNVATPTDVTAAGGGITLLGDTNKTITWNNSTDGWELNQPVKVTGNIVTTGSIDVQGGTVTDSTGALSITTGASNGNITLDPNGTGNVVMTFANGGNLTNDRNYLSGIIRQTAAASAGDIYGYNTGTTVPYRGISIDNTASATTTTGKRTGMVMRNYANAPRNSIIGETARGTNPSSPTQLTNNSNIIELVAGGWAGVSDGTGFTSTGSTISGTTLTIGTLVSGTVAVGQLISSWTAGVNVTTGTTITANISGSGSGSTWTVSQSQTVASSAINGGGDGWLSSLNGLGGAIRLQAFENWTNQTSGTGVVVSLSPLSSTLGLAGATFNALTMSLSSTTLASDTQAFRTRPAGAGGTNFTMLNLTESLATVGGDLRINGNDIQASDGSTNITLSGNTLTTVAGDLKVGGNDIQASDGNTNISMTSNTLTTLAGNLQVNGGGTSIIKSNEFRVNNSSNNYLSSVVDNGTRAQYTWSSPYTSSSLLLDLDATASVFALYAASADGSVTPTFNFNAFRESAGSKSPTQSGDRLGQFTFNGNLTTGSGPTSANVVGGELRWYAVEDWDNTKSGTAVAIEIVKPGTNTNLNVFLSSGVSTEIVGDTTTFRGTDGNTLSGGNIDYRRTYGCFHKIANVTAGAANTVYNFDWYTDTTAHVGNQGVTVTSGNPTRLNIDTQGSYEVVVEMQTKNTANADRTAWIWLAKNGTDLSETRIKVSLRPATSGDVYQLITKMWCVDNLADNDYLEVRFAVDNASGISLEYEAAQTSPFAMPAQPSATVTISPIGA